MANLSKSKLLAFRQCPKRLWLEEHRSDVKEKSSTDGRLQIGHQLGEIARRLYDPTGSGTVINSQAEGIGPALALSLALLDTSAPIFEAGFSAGRAIAFTDVMLPMRQGPKLSWRIVEVKSTTSIKDYHRDDLALQAFVALSAGVPLHSVLLAHIDSEWVYTSESNYHGLLKENDLTDEVLSRGNEIKEWIEDAHALVQQPLEPINRTGSHCSKPYECDFLAYCKGQEPEPEYPIAWLPRLQNKATQEFVASKALTDLRDVPDEYLNDIQRRVKAHTVSGEPFFDKAAAVAELAQYELPALFLDFETIQFGIPVWKETRPYQQIPFQFSLHSLTKMSTLNHCEFLDLSGNDPSRRFGEELIAGCGQFGPVFVYNASFETTRLAELGDRFPRLRPHFLAIAKRIVDLLPVVRRNYYHPSQQGSWSIKSVLPTLATDLRYDNLNGVQDGGMATTAYLEAVHPQTSTSRKEELRQQLLDYCRLDTYALVMLWQYFSGRNEVGVSS